MDAIANVVSNVFRMIDRRIPKPCHLLRINEQLRIAFDAQLGGSDITCGGEGVWTDKGVLRIVIDQESVSVLFYVNGVRERSWDYDGRRAFCVLSKGQGRAFKFMRHEPDHSVALNEFYSFGFPYEGSALTISKNGRGTIARVKESLTSVRFFVDEDARVTTDGVIHDLRTYERPDLLVEGVRKVFERIILGTDVEWERLFRLLFR